MLQAFWISLGFYPPRLQIYSQMVKENSSTVASLQHGEHSWGFPVDISRRPPFFIDTDDSVTRLCPVSVRLPCFFFYLDNRNSPQSIASNSQHHWPIIYMRQNVEWIMIIISKLNSFSLYCKQNPDCFYSLLGASCQPFLPLETNYSAMALMVFSLLWICCLSLGALLCIKYTLPKFCLCETHGHTFLFLHLSENQCFSAKLFLFIAPLMQSLAFKSYISVLYLFPL